MSAFRRLCITVISIFLLLTAGLDLMLIKQERTENGQYRVEAKRLADEIAETGSYDASGYPHIMGVFPDDEDRLYASDEHYLIMEVNGRLYRVEYKIDGDRRTLFMVNCVLCAVLLMVAGLLYGISTGISLFPSAD